MVVVRNRCKLGLKWAIIEAIYLIFNDIIWSDPDLKSVENTQGL
jgi:hypothetical protein